MFESYGLTPSQAIKLFLSQVAETNSVPLSFDYQAMPNTYTLKAVAAFENGHYDEFPETVIND